MTRKNIDQLHISNKKDKFLFVHIGYVGKTSRLGLVGGDKRHGKKPARADPESMSRGNSAHFSLGVEGIYHEMVLLSKMGGCRVSPL